MNINVSTVNFGDTEVGVLNQQLAEKLKKQEIEAKKFEAKMDAQIKKVRG